MKKSKTRLLLPVVGGLLLIAAGVLLLLGNLEIITLNWEMLIGPMFGIGGLVFLLVFILNTDEWWALIPGFILVGLGINTFMGQYMETMSGQWGGAVFLGFIGLAFIVIYFFHNEHWWAIIPGGVLLTLAGVTLLPATDALSGGVFFLGMALTFGLVYILPKPAGKLTWALYPAGILFLIGLAIMLNVANLINYIWPVALLIAGGYLIFRALRS